MIAHLIVTGAAAVATVPTAVDAERAFNADAQRLGQWTAFRKYAAEDAVMFTPQAVWAHEFLKQRKDPPRGLKWWPAYSFVSCDGRTAVNSGPWINGGKHGFFTTIWQRDGNSWRWVYDSGEQLKGPVPKVAKPPVRMRKAACNPAPGAPVIGPVRLSAREAAKTPEDSGRGESADKSLGWDWKVEKNGRRYLRVFQWTGQRYAQVLHNDSPGQ